MDCSRRLNLSLNAVKRYARADAPERLRRVPKYRPTLVDPYREHLRERRAAEPAVPVQQLLREIRGQGTQGSSNLLTRYLNQGRADDERPHLSPRRAARLLLTRPDRLTPGQQERLDHLAAACPEVTGALGLIQAFAALLKPDEANVAALEEWIKTGPRGGPSPRALLRPWHRAGPRHCRRRVHHPTPQRQDRRREHPDQDAQAPDVRTSWLQTPTPPDPPRLSAVSRHHRKCARAGIRQSPGGDKPLSGWWSCYQVRMGVAVMWGLG